MKLAPCVTGIATLATLGAGLASLQQQGRLAALQTEVAKLQAAQTVASTRQPPAPVQPATDELSEADRLELLRLRGEVTRLRARQEQLAPLRVENQTLREQVRQKSPPPGYVGMREAQFVGQATPDATFQSFIWAIAKEDTNALYHLLSEEAAERLMHDLQQRGQAELLTAARIIPGYRLVAVKQRSSTEAILEVELLPGQPPQEMPVRLTDGRWRLSF